MSRGQRPGGGIPQAQSRPRQNSNRSDDGGYYGDDFLDDYGADAPPNNPPPNYPPPQQQPRGGNFGGPPPSGQYRGGRPAPGPFGPQGQRRPDVNGRGGPQNGYGMNGPPSRGPGPYRGGRPGGPPNGRSPQRQMRGGPPSQNLKLGFDNPFPHFSAGPPPPSRSNTMPIEQGMANMSMNGRPPPDNSRPLTSASKTSGKSTNSYQSEGSHYETDPTSYESSMHDSFDRNGAPPFDARGQPPPIRSMTMPNEMRSPPGDRRPPTSQGAPPPDMGFNQRPRDPIALRSASANGLRPGMVPGPGPIGPPMRSQTFDSRPPPQSQYQQSPPRQQPSHKRNDTLDDYMPNFDAAPDNAHVEDLLGIPLDIPRPATRNGNQSPAMNRSKSQPDFRENGYNGYGHPEETPPMPLNAMRYDEYDAIMEPPNPGYGAPMSRSGTPQGQRMPPGPHPPPFRPGLENQHNYSDPGYGRGQPMRGPPGGMGRDPRSANPDALPFNPEPEDGSDRFSGPPASYKAGSRGSGMSSQRQPSLNHPPQEEAPPEKPVTWLELNDLRDAVKGRPSDYKTQFRLATRLVEAADVLADEDGQADKKQKNKNREKFLLEAHKNIKKLVSHSYPEAMFYLADCYGTGRLGLAVDHKEAFGLYQAAGKLGHGPSAFRTAVSCELGGEATRKDPLKAVQWYRRAASLGETGAMYKLGMILLRGMLGQQQSVGEAIIWLNRSAERADPDNPHALHELGVLHENPPRNVADKIIRDEKYALQLYEQAAKLGYAKSQCRLGKAFEAGTLGVRVDDRASIHWFSKAAATGDPEAELALSGWYLTGSRGVLETNDQEAYLWARKSAMKEFAKAEYAMGYYSEVGIGCPVNLEDAKRWYGRAACKS